MPAIQCALRLFDSFNSETTKINYQFLNETCRGRAGSRDVVAGGALEAEVLNRAAKAAKGEGESVRGG